MSQSAESVLTARLRLSGSGLFWLLLVLNVINHLLVFILVNLNYVDSDQAFMWGGLADYAKLEFYEPRWYGQDYSTFIEAIVALPFYWCQLPVYWSLPLATHLLAFLPYLVPAIFLYRRREYQSSLLFLAIPLCLSLAFDIITGIPRGFVGGIAFTSCLILSLRDPNNLKWVMLNAAMAVVGYFVNPNSLLVSAPILFYVFLNNYKTPRYYACMAVVLPVYLACYFLFDLFYRQHPTYIIYAVNLEFSSAFLKNNLLHLQQRLAHVGFFSSTHPWFLFGAFLLLVTGLWIFNRKGFFASLLIPLIILVGLCSNKGGDGSDSPFYSFSRSFIGLPLVFGLFASLIPWRSNFLMKMATVLAMFFSLFKLYTYRPTLRQYLDPSTWLGVHLVKIPQAIESMETYKQHCKKNDCRQLMVSNNFWLNTVLSYGGEAIYQDFPLAFETNNERRFWRREGLRERVVQRFIYISSRNDLEQYLSSDHFTLQRLDDYGLYLVTKNKLTNGVFIQLVWDAEKEEAIKRP